MVVAVVADVARALVAEDVARLPAHDRVAVLFVEGTNGIFVVSRT